MLELVGLHMLYIALGVRLALLRPSSAVLEADSSTANAYALDVEQEGPLTFSHWVRQTSRDACTWSQLSMCLCSETCIRRAGSCHRLSMRLQPRTEQKMEPKLTASQPQRRPSLMPCPKRLMLHPHRESSQVGGVAAALCLLVHDSCSC